jgi:hypothetical protein
MHAPSGGLSLGLSLIQLLCISGLSVHLSGFLGWLRAATPPHLASPRLAVAVVEAFTPPIAGGLRMVATPDRRVVAPRASEAPFDPLGGDNAVLSRNNAGNAWVPQRARPRRNRKSAAIRGMVRETIVRPSNFIYPLFIHDESYEQDIASMPGCQRHSLPHMLKEVEDAWRFGVRSFVLFPKVADELKTNYADECYNPSGIVPRAVRCGIHFQDTFLFQLVD